MPSTHKLSGFLKPGKFLLFISVIACLCLYSCNSNRQASEQAEVNNAKVDSFTQVHVQYAQGFSVKYGDHYKVVEVYQPFEGSKDTLRYLLLPHGVAKPKEYENLETIEIPVKRIVCLSTTHVALATLLNADSLIVGISGARFIYDEGVKKLIAANKIAEVGTDATLDNEKIVSLHPDIVMAYHTGNADYDGYERLEKLGLKIVINADFMETTPLGLAEWVKFFSVFINKEEDANQQFAAIEKDYKTLSALAATAQNKPTVFTGISWQGSWSVPGGQSFAAQYLHDAGAQYIYSDIPSTGKKLFDFEKIFSDAHDTDYWINPGAMGSLNEIADQDPRYKKFKAFKTGMIFSDDVRVNDNGGFDYFESGVTHPQTILADLIHILHPKLLPTHDLVYYRQLK